ncbi:carbohydrate deacetylase [Hyphomonas adhaerens]|uniref:carbohydrate deacetylase n=1 Tax=Hyphomonas adhaerens TaxID=81029 RepID=UPI00235744BE|nr:ChbG/HpnK family deacetylase [Hyphomonas adhaerens]
MTEAVPLTPTPDKTAKSGLRLIVHADDFGLSERVNEGVADAHLNGILTSTSIMACAPAFDHAVRIAKATPSLDIGVHLTLIEERPLTDPAKVPSLVDETGHFHKHITVFAKRYFRGLIDLDEVRLELDAQIARIKEAGLAISHLDSHQHVHMLPGILSVAQDLGRKHGIAPMRLPRETVSPYMLTSPGGLPRVAQQLVLNHFCNRARKGFGPTTDRFAGFHYGGKLDTAALLTVVSNLPETGTCELMCHPGEDDPASDKLHWGYAWANELSALKDASVAAKIEAKGIRLISFRDLTA